MTGSSYRVNIGYEMLVVARTSQKGSQLHHICNFFQLLIHFSLAFDVGHVSLSNNVAKILQSAESQLALGRLEMEPISLGTSKDDLKYLHVGLPVWAMEEDVIHLA